MEVRQGPVFSAMQNLSLAVLRLFRSCWPPRCDFAPLERLPHPLAATPELPLASSAAIAPPWCGTPIRMGWDRFRDGSDPAIRQAASPIFLLCYWLPTLDDIQPGATGVWRSRSVGQSALGRDMYLVTTTHLTHPAAEDFQTWQNIRKIALTETGAGSRNACSCGDEVKVQSSSSRASTATIGRRGRRCSSWWSGWRRRPYGTDPEGRRHPEPRDPASGMLFTIRMGGSPANGGTATTST